MRTKNTPYENCTSGKVAYSSLSQAKAAAKRVSCNSEFRAYWCPICGKYHISSTYSRENHEIYKNGHKYNRLETNKTWNMVKQTIEIPVGHKASQGMLNIKYYSFVESEN